MSIAMDQFTMSQLGQLRWAATGRRVRAVVAGTTVVDSPAARIVWEPNRVVGSFAVPMADVHAALTDGVAVAPAIYLPPVLTPGNAFGMHSCAGTSWTIDAPGGALAGAGFTPDDPDLASFVLLDWQAFDQWWEEEQQVFVHPHDPFQRIECFPTSRHVTVSLDGMVVAESDRPTLLQETHLPPRHYLPREDVWMDLLESSDSHTSCAYKGQASYWSVRVGDHVVTDGVWTYPDPLRDGEPVKDLLCFFDERFDVTVDGVSTGRPRTPWS